MDFNWITVAPTTAVPPEYVTKKRYATTHFCTLKCCALYMVEAVA